MSDEQPQDSAPAAASSDLPFGQWIKLRRRELDLTQDALAERVGYATPTIQKLEQGARRPSRDLTERLLEALEVSPAERPAILRRARLQFSAPEPAPAPPVVAERPALRRSLPLEPTPFVGREQELASLRQLLADSASRLVTIVGPGGMGKTRLALRAAYALADNFADGACWISLAAVPSAELLLPSIADALGLTFPVTADVEAHLLRSLEQRHLLLVLDNLEHLAGDLTPLARMLAAAPRLQILATSRVRLNLREEWVWELGGLSAAPGGRADAEGAIALFVQSARKVRQDFALDPRDVAAVAQICALVDGMPLGIELAAAWSRILTPQEIAAELARDLDFLTSSLANVEDRHRSLRAVFRASWALLAPDEQAIVRRLSVFQGGFTREAAAAVAGAALPALLSLANKSFVRRTPAGPGEWRFDMHEVIRQYAGEQLEQGSAEAEAARAAHARLFAAALAAADPALKSAGQQEALARLRAEIHNLRAAWDWLVAHREVAELRRITAALAYFYELCAWNQEGARAFERAAAALAPAGEAPGASPDELGAYGTVLLNGGWFQMRVGATERAYAEIDRAAALLARGDDRLVMANVHFGLGYVATLLGRYDEAAATLAAGLDLARSVDYPWMTAIILTAAGTAARARGRADEAAELLGDARRQWRRTGEPRGTAWCLNELGALLLAAGRLDEAAAALQEGLSLSIGVDDPWSSGTAYSLLGQLARLRADDAEAGWLLGQSLALFRAIDARAEIVQALLALAALSQERGAPGEARRLLGEALQTAASAQVVPLALGVLTRIAGLLAEGGAAARAAELCARVLADPSASQATRDEAARLASAPPAAPAPAPWTLAEAVAAGQLALRASGA